MLARARPKRPKRTVEWDGQFYKVRSDNIDIPDLKAMSRFAALTWLCANTYARGYSRPNPLAGMAGAIKIVAR